MKCPTLRSSARAKLSSSVAMACLSSFGVAEELRPGGASVTSLPRVTVEGTLPDRLDAVPGSSSVVTRKELDARRPYSLREAIEGVPGLHLVGEDAFSNNLNIGVRGLDPRRTSRTLLLEDGMPIHLAPYSDPSAHYQTPLERLERIEVIKGSGQMVHGPQTVGGVINFVTREVPTDGFEAGAEAAAGNRSFRRVAAHVGHGTAAGGWRLDAMQREGDGTREHNHHQLRDVQLKGRLTLGDAQQLRVKLGYFEEDSNFGEAGTDQARFEADPYNNPFRNDRFELERWAAQAVHTVDVSERARISTNLYWQKTDRASYRQLDAISEDGENETLRDNVGAPDSTDIAGCPADIDYTVPDGFEDFAAACGNAMRPRSYTFYGIEPRLELTHGAFGLRSELVAGVRLHREDITRKRYNGATPDARETSPGSALRDRFEIETQATSAFVQNTFYAGDWTFTPGVRYERYRQTNRATQFDFAAADTEVTAKHSEVLPGFGLTYLGVPNTTFFAGIHRGFAPPRPDANVDPSVVLEGDDFVPVDAEISTNVEAGLRTMPRPGVQAEATLFQIAFKDQIVPGDAVGLGQTFANAGRSKTRGLELGGRIDFGTLRGTPKNVYVTANYTGVFTAEFDSDLDVDGSNVRGNRLPYAPRSIAGLSLGYEHGSRWDARLGVQHVSSQYSDALNTVAGADDGQSGRIDAYTTLNATLNYRLPQHGLTLFVGGANLTDREYIIGRVNGIHVGAPRQVYAGLRWSL